ncbi:MAG: SIR2 family protein, partial [Ignavibacteriales bacterium]|nr:SIR2 family protein [Ignavibacteriales bacterium]
MTTSEKIGFLFGSGISFPAKLPSMDEITQILLNGEGVIRHTDETYYLSENKSEYFLSGEYIPRVTAFLGRIKTEIDSYYSEDTHKTNYEDIYYVVSQIKDSELKDYDNPAIKPLIDRIYPDIKSLLDKQENDTHYDWTLLDLATESTNCIRDVVWRCLLRSPERLDHLQVISDACNDKNIANVDIFTLNHDILLEQYFSNTDIRVNDGFGPPQENNKRYWNPELFEKNEYKVRLFKLHGSINWFTFNRNDKRGLEEIAILLDWDIWHTKDLSGKRQWPAGGRPKFLAGTFNKMLNYSFDIYADQHYQFHKSLRGTKNLIVCGYGFHDKGINIKIAEWLYADERCKLIVIHPKPDDLVSSARGVISNNWDSWETANKLQVINKGIEEINWDLI